MNKAIIACIAAALVLSIAGPAVAASQKIATVNAELVLASYNKTRLAEKEIERQKSEFKSEMARMKTKLEALEETYEEAREKTHSTVLTKKARETALEDAEEKLMQVKEYEAEIVRFAEQSKKRMVEQSVRMTKKFKTDIDTAIEKHAKKKKITLVIDTSAALSEWKKTVIYSDESIDITKDIIEALNAEESKEDMWE